MSQKDHSVNPPYQREQGQNMIGIVAEILLLVMAVGSIWRIDNVTGSF
jgi:hypothetical protein